MLGVEVTITRWVSDEPQPGIVECELLDANGHRWLFREKAAIVSAEPLSARSTYPCSGSIACRIVGQHSVDGSASDVVRIDTELPWGVASIEGITTFDVLRRSLSTIRD